MVTSCSGTPPVSWPWPCCPATYSSSRRARSSRWGSRLTALATGICKPSSSTPTPSTGPRSWWSSSTTPSRTTSTTTRCPTNGRTESCPCPSGTRSTSTSGCRGHPAVRGLPAAPAAALRLGVAHRGLRPHLRHGDLPPPWDGARRGQLPGLARTVPGPSARLRRRARRAAGRRGVHRSPAGARGAAGGAGRADACPGPSRPGPPGRGHHGAAADRHRSPVPAGPVPGAVRAAGGPGAVPRPPGHRLRTDRRGPCSTVPGARPRLPLLHHHVVDPERGAGHPHRPERRTTGARGDAGPGGHGRAPHQGPVRRGPRRGAPGTGDRADAARDPAGPDVHELSGHRQRKETHMRPVKIGIGGPVGAGKTQLIERLTRALSHEISMAAITNDIYTIEDAEILSRNSVLPLDRIVGIETGGCPHTAIREDTSMNQAAIDELEATHPDLEVIFVESGGDNLSATFSPELVDFSIYIIDVAQGEKIPRKAGQGMIKSDLFIINKTDLAPYVGADLSVMEADSKSFRGNKAYCFTNLKTDEGLDGVIRWLRHDVLMQDLV